MRAVVLVIAAIAGCGLPAEAAITTATIQRPATRFARLDTASRGSRMDSTLALATFDSAWRTVAMSLEHRGVTRIDWSAVRRELRPLAVRAESDAAVRAIIDDMLRRVGESHFTIMPAQDAGASAGAGRTHATLGTAGLAIRFVDGRLTVWRTDSAGAAARAGIRAGLVVDRIDAFEVPELDARDTVGVRRLAVLTGAMRALGGDPGAPVRLVVRGADGVPREVSFARDSVRGPVSRFGNLPPLPAGFEGRRVVLADGRCVGVLRFDYWLPPVMPAIDRAVDGVRECAGIVVDLRGNLGGVAGMMMGVAGHFLNETRTLGTMRARGEEMRFVSNPRRATDAGVPVTPFEGSLAIVVDGLSASTSEMFAAGLQSIGRARIFGERTAGQALPAMATRLPNGDILMHVVADFVTPDGGRLEGQGVIPDEVVPLRLDEIRAGHDEALEAALRWIERARPDRRE